MREYFIAALEDVWDYAPAGRENCGSTPAEALGDTAKGYLVASASGLGRRHIKAQYVEFTDATFTKRKVRAQPLLCHALGSAPAGGNSGSAQSRLQRLGLGAGVPRASMGRHMAWVHVASYVAFSHAPPLDALGPVQVPAPPLLPCSIQRKHPNPTALRRKELRPRTQRARLYTYP